MEILAIPLLLLVGALLSLQAGANVQLASATRSPFGASALQLGLGALLLLALAALLGTLGSLDLVDDVEAWHLLGGLGSAVYITAGILLFPRLGAIVSVGLFVAGQTLVSLLLGPHRLARREPAGARRAGRRGRRRDARRHRAGRARPGAPGARPAGLDRAGARRGRRAPGPGRDQRPAARRPRRADRRGRLELRDRGRRDAARAGRRARPRARGSRGSREVPWWGWLGALCGATYVTSVFLLIPEIGVAPTIGLTIAGQQIASVFVDRYGLLRLPQRSISNVRLAGVAALLAGVAAIQFT